MRKISVGIIGVGNDICLELIKILISHPYFNLTYLANTTGDTTLEQLYPSLQKVYRGEIFTASIDTAKEHCELLFLALPQAQDIAKEAIKQGLKVVDLSKNIQSDVCLEGAVYGLIEWQRGLIGQAKIIANPSHHATAALLGILPFTPYIDPFVSVFIDSKSAMSDTSKNPNHTTHFCHIHDNIFAYDPLSHPHTQEISEMLYTLGGGYDCKVQFVPHFIPIARGLITSIFIRLKSERIDTSAILKDCYRGEKAIRIQQEPLQLKRVIGTHFCDIFIKQDGKDLWINTAIDNLLRGASSQAIANANLMYGFEESALPYMPHA